MRTRSFRRTGTKTYLAEDDRRTKSLLGMIVGWCESGNGEEGEESVIFSFRVKDAQAKFFGSFVDE